jgi:4-hydroxythreonine-4-phosphate dehydrogenase
MLADYDDYSIPMFTNCGPSKAGGEASLRFCTDAIEAARAGLIDAVVTAPISKVSWNLAGAEWPGHTELLAAKCKTSRKAMMFAAGNLKIALATIHISIADIRNKFTIEAFMTD